MKKVTNIMMVGILALFAGCDDVLSGLFTGSNQEAKEQERELRLQREQEERDKENLAQNLTVAIRTKKKDLDKTISNLEKEATELDKDLATLSSEVAKAMDEKTANGKEEKYEMKILHAMRNPEISGLALKYIGNDLSSMAAEFIEKGKVARKEESRYRKAIQDADENYDKAIGETKNWTEDTRKQREQEIERLRSEIAHLQHKQAGIRKDIEKMTKYTLGGSRDQELDRNNKAAVLYNKISDCDAEISKKRRQLDVLTNPDYVAKLESKTNNDTQHARRNAAYNHDQQLRDIKRNMQPSKGIVEIAKEYEEASLGKIRDAINKKLAETKEVIEVSKASCKLLQEMELKIPVSSLQDLETLRKEFMKIK